MVDNFVDHVEFYNWINFFFFCKDLSEMTAADERGTYRTQLIRGSCCPKFQKPI